MFRMSRSVWSAPYSGAFVVSLQLHSKFGGELTFEVDYPKRRNTAHSRRFAWFGSAGLTTDAPYRLLSLRR